MLTGPGEAVPLSCTLASPIAFILLLIGNLFSAIGLAGVQSALAALGGQILTLAGCP